MQLAKASYWLLEDLPSLRIGWFSAKKMSKQNSMQIKKYNAVLRKFFYCQVTVLDNRIDCSLNCQKCPNFSQEIKNSFEMAGSHLVWPKQLPLNSNV